MKLIYKSDLDLFIFEVPYSERHIARELRFTWHPLIKKWATQDARTAYRVIEFADQATKRCILKELNLNQSEIKPVLDGYDFTPMPHQKDAVAYACKNAVSYLALAPGLGKTFTGVMIINSLYDHNIGGHEGYYLIVCPPFLCATWADHFVRAGLPAPRIIRKTTENLTANGSCTLIVPDSIIGDKKIRAQLGIMPLELLMVDEAHRFKNDSAVRTKALIGGRFKSGIKWDKLKPKRTVFMSGTPILGRPIEIFALTASFAPQVFNYTDKHSFALRYCNANHNGYGWDYSGASNKDELGRLLKKDYMLVQNKDIIKLPPKINNMIVISEDETSKKTSILTKHALKQTSIDEIVRDPQRAFAEFSEVRHALGIEKVDFATEYIANALEESEAIVVFAWHKDVIARLSYELKDVPHKVITGDVHKDERQGIVDSFQKDKKLRLLLCNIEAAGVGFTLTRADRCIFVEASWTPAINEQASDRLHRIGQDKTVTVDYLVKEKSLDYFIVSALLKKQNNINQILQGGIK